MNVPRVLQDLLRHGFEVAHQALYMVEDDDHHVTKVPPDADSAHVTGYHPAASTNSLSRYKVHREGFVFSDDNTIEDVIPDFGNSMALLLDCLHDKVGENVGAMGLQYSAKLDGKQVRKWNQIPYHGGA